MATAKCFMCGDGYNTTDPDDIEGDGKCQPCKERSKKIAFKLDIERSQKALKQPVSRIRQLFSEEEIKRGEAAGGRRINARDLGIL